MPQIGQESDVTGRGGQQETHRIGGIVRHAEGADLDLA